MIYQFKADIPYPTTDNITCDRESAMIIAPAYSGLLGELAAICLYTYQHLNFYKCELYELSDAIEKIAITEMMHFDILGKTLINLGVDPVLSERPPYLCNFFNTSKLKYSKTPQKMLMDAITGELNAIKDYRCMLEKLRNEQVSAIIERIILDEEVHVCTLTQMLNTVVNSEKKVH